MGFIGLDARAAYFMAAAMLTGIGAGLPALSQSQGPSVIVVNDDSEEDPIHSVFIWHEDSHTMGPNRLVAELIGRDPPWLFFGESVEITLHGGGMRDRCEFLILVEDNDGDRSGYEVNLCEIDHVVHY